MEQLESRPHHFTPYFAKISHCKGFRQFLINLNADNARGCAPHIFVHWGIKAEIPRQAPSISFDRTLIALRLRSVLPATVLTEPRCAL